MSRVSLALLVAGAGTFTMRFSFLATAHRMSTVGPGVQRVLRQIPPAVLAALILPGLLRPGGDLDVVQIRPLAGAAVALVAWRTRSPVWSLAAGTVVLAVAEWVG